MGTLHRTPPPTPSPAAIRSGRLPGMDHVTLDPGLGWKGGPGNEEDEAAISRYIDTLQQQPVGRSPRF
jgi:hypothetical protein